MVLLVLSSASLPAQWALWGIWQRLQRWGLKGWDCGPLSQVKEEDRAGPGQGDGRGARTPSRGQLGGGPMLPALCLQPPSPWQPSPWAGPAGPLAPGAKSPQVLRGSLQVVLVASTIS